MIFWIFILDFARDIGQLARIWIGVSSDVIDILMSIWISVDQLITSYLLHRADETQQGRNSCPRLQMLAFSLNSIMSLPR